MDLKEYIGEYLNRGYSIDKVKESLVSNGFDSGLIDKTYQEIVNPAPVKQKGSALVGIAISAGFVSISVLAITILLFLLFFFKVGGVLGYFLVGVVSLGLGFFADYVITRTKNDSSRVGAGLSTPIVPVFLIMISFVLFGVIQDVVSKVPFDISSKLAFVSLNGLVAGSIFYGCFVLPMVLTIFKGGKKMRLLVFILIPIILFLLFFLTNFLGDVAEDRSTAVTEKVGSAVLGDDFSFDALTEGKNYEDLTEEEKALIDKIKGLPPEDLAKLVQVSTMPDDEASKLMELIE